MRKKIRCDVNIENLTRRNATKLPDWADEDDNIPTLKNVALGIKAGVYTFKYDYPLSVTVEFKERIGPKTTDVDVAMLIKKHYRTIYRTDDAEIRRGWETTTYGVWGHDMHDLIIEAIIIDDARKTVNMDIGS